MPSRMSWSSSTFTPLNGTPMWFRIWTTWPEKPHIGNCGVPFMKSTTSSDFTSVSMRVLVSVMADLLRSLMPRIEKLVKAANGGFVVEGFGENLVERKWAAFRDSGRDAAPVGQELAGRAAERFPPESVQIDFLAHRRSVVVTRLIQEASRLNGPSPPGWRVGIAEALQDVH